MNPLKNNVRAILYASVVLFTVAFVLGCASLTILLAVHAVLNGLSFISSATDLLLAIILALLLLGPKRRGMRRILELYALASFQESNQGSQD